MFQGFQLCSESAGHQSPVHIQGPAAGGVAPRYIHNLNVQTIILGYMLELYIQIRDLGQPNPF